MFQLPTNKIWNQTNTSDSLGSLAWSFNVDLVENEGKMRVGKRLLLATGTADVSELNSYPVGFRGDYSSTKLYTIAGYNNVGYVFKSATTGSALSFTKMTDAGSPSDLDSTSCDIESAFQCTYISSYAGNKIYKINAGGTFSSFTVNASASTFPLMLCYYNSRVYCSYFRNNILSWDSSDTINTVGTSYALTLPANQKITFIRAASDRLWVGTIGDYGVKGYVYEWNGTTVSAQKEHRLDSTGALACVIKDDIPYVMDANGKLLAWNGGTFKEVARLFRRKNKHLIGANADYNTRFIHPNGMSIVNNKINLLINGANNDTARTQEETIPSGIWEYDEQHGLYHKYSMGLTKSGGTITDYGQNRVNGVGGLSELIQSASVNDVNGILIAGATVYTNATATSSGVWYDDTNDTLQKAGYLVSNKMEADDTTPYHLPSVQNMYQNIYTLYRKLLNSTDKMVIKWRTEEIEPTTATITWTSSTTFFTSTNVSGMEGYEVEIMQGFGGGRCPHIQSIAVDTGVYTVTIDETLTGVTSTGIARITNWKKVSTIDTTSSATFDQCGIGQLSNWIQVKVHMLFTGKNEIEKVIIINQNANPAN
jgi:hypothetical protein